MDPPGADLGEMTGPEPDSRMIHFLGSIDGYGQPLPMTYRRLRARADTYTITRATPDGPRNLLKTARDMFALGFYSYEMVAAAAAWSIFAVEAALKCRLEAGSNIAMQRLIDIAKKRGLVSEHLTDILDTGRRIRKEFVHQGVQPTWTFGMADMVIGASFKIVAELYPDEPMMRRAGRGFVRRRRVLR